MSDDEIEAYAREYVDAESIYGLREALRWGLSFTNGDDERAATFGQWISEKINFKIYELARARLVLHLEKIKTD